MKRSPMKPGTKGLARTPFKSFPIASFSVRKPDVKRSTLKTKQRTRTPAEIDLHDRLAALGCIACLKDGTFNPHVSIHHVHGRTAPGCHRLVLPLCAGHHQDGTGEDKTLVAVHPWKTRFEQRYGNQLALVAECMTLIGEK